METFDTISSDMTRAQKEQYVNTAQGFHKSPEGIAHESEEGAIYSGVQACLTTKRC